MTIADPRLALLYDYWRSKRGGRNMPSPESIDVAKLPAAVQPNVMILDVVREGGAVRFRYARVGAVFLRGAAKDPVGRFVDEALPTTAGYCKYVVGIYEEMARTCRPMYTENLFILQHGQTDPMAAKRVSLPMSRDGFVVDQVLAAHVFDYGSHGGDDGMALVTAIEERVREFLD